MWDAGDSSVFGGRRRASRSRSETGRRQRVVQLAGQAAVRRVAEPPACMHQTTLSSMPSAIGCRRRKPAGPPRDLVEGFTLSAQAGCRPARCTSCRTRSAAGLRQVASIWLTHAIRSGPPHIGCRERGSGTDRCEDREAGASGIPAAMLCATPWLLPLAGPVRTSSSCGRGDGADILELGVELQCPGAWVLLPGGTTQGEQGEPMLPTRLPPTNRRRFVHPRSPRCRPMSSDGVEAVHDERTRGNHGGGPHRLVLGASSVRYRRSSPGQLGRPECRVPAPRRSPMPLPGLHPSSQARSPTRTAARTLSSVAAAAGTPSTCSVGPTPVGPEAGVVVRGRHGPLPAITMRPCRMPNFALPCRAYTPCP